MNVWLEKNQRIIYISIAMLIGIASIVFALRWRNPAAITIQPPQPTTIPGPISVYVSGSVIQPGVYELSAGSRVEDALNIAGGPSPDADLTHVNLAASLSDGAQVYIPFEGEFSSEVFLENGTVGLDDPSAGLININTATSEELCTLPGIGETYASRIIEYREANGPFENIHDLINVSGIGPATFLKIEALITIGE